MRAALCDLHKGRFLRAFALERENGKQAVACVIDAYRSCNVCVSHTQLRALGLGYTGKRSLNVCRIHLELLNAVGWRVLLDERVSGLDPRRVELPVATWALAGRLPLPSDGKGSGVLTLRRGLL